MTATLIQGRQYRHMSCLDVDMVILSVGYVGITYTKAKVCFVHQREGWLYEGGTVTVKHEDMYKWIPVSN